MLRASANPLPYSGVFTAQAPIAACVDAALAAEWEELAGDASEPNSYGEHWFIDSALRHYRGEETVRLAQVRAADGQLIGILPLVSSPRYGRFPVTHVSNWVHLQCYCGSPLIRAGFESEFWTNLLELLEVSDWAGNFFSLRLVRAGGPVRQGLGEAAKAAGRDYHIAQAYDRAVLASDAAPQDYINATIRAKKRKEFRRQAKRLAELGEVAFEQLGSADSVADWCDQFLELEAAGWKGEGGTALGADNHSQEFFSEIMSSAHALGRVDFLRLTLDGRPIAMLVNLRSPPGVWSYKITYDEKLARYSPGVLLELETIGQVLGDPEILWADSCAKPDHPMINSLWGERQPIEQITISLKGPLRKTAYNLCRSADLLGASLREKRKQAHD